MTAISELKYACVGGPLQVRILRKWKPDNRRHETWYLAVDKFVSYPSLNFNLFSVFVNFFFI